MMKASFVFEAAQLSIHLAIRSELREIFIFCSKILLKFHFFFSISFLEFILVHRSQNYLLLNFVLEQLMHSGSNFIFFLQIVLIRTKKKESKKTHLEDSRECCLMILR